MQLSKHGSGRKLLSHVKQYAEREREIVALEDDISAAIEMRRKAQKRALAAIDALDGIFDKVDKSQAVIDAIVAAKEAQAKADRDTVEWSKLYKHTLEKFHAYTLGPAGQEKIRREIKKLEAEKPTAPEDIKIPDMPKPLDRAEVAKLKTKLSSAVEAAGAFSVAADHVAQLIAKRDELKVKMAEEEREIAAGVESFRQNLEREKTYAFMNNL